MAVGVVEVVGGVSKRVYLELGEEVLGCLLEEPVEDQATLDGTLRVQDKDNFGVLWVVQFLLDDAVADADIGGSKAQVPLDKTLDDVKDDSGPGLLELGP